MRIDQHQLLADLKSRTQSVISDARKFNVLETYVLNWKPGAERWSILECLEHLNLYGDFYLPEIERCISNAARLKEKKLFKSGLLGNYFALTMLPKDGRVKKMKTFKDKDPANGNLSPAIPERFLQQQTKLLELLDQAEAVDLNKVKTGISISRMIKLKLGDTFRVVVYHNQRHLLQAQNVLKEMSTSAVTQFR